MGRSRLNYRNDPRYSSYEFNDDGEPLLDDDYTRPDNPEKEFDPKFTSSPNELFSEIDQSEAKDLKRALKDVDLKERNIKRQGGNNRRAIIAISPSGMELEYESYKELSDELGISADTVRKIITDGNHMVRNKQWRRWRFRYKD